MTTTAYAVRDSATMLRRNLRRLERYPSLALFPILIPVVLLLLFVYIFGGTLGNGLGGPPGGRSAYVDYLAPGILLFTIAGAAQMVAISVAKDMTEGIIARFRTMAIWRPSVLAGHVLANVIQSLLSVCVVVGVALLAGFRPTADTLDWLGAAGLLAFAALALAWLCVALGLVTKSVEAASNLPMLLTLLPFLSSSFVPVDSMPAGIRWFAEHQPFTPITDTLRGLLRGEHVGTSAITAITWCAAITVIAYLWAQYLYDRRPIR
jgi:ABC-2 type transport system permease protein